MTRLDRLRAGLVGHAVDLGVFRIAVAGVWLTSSAVYRAPQYAEWSLGARAAQVAVYVGAAMGLVGAFPRVAFAAVALVGAGLLGLSHAAGVGLHDHHMVWFAALLASSPCGDALAWGRWRARPPPSVAHGLPIRAAWLMLAAIFFWPGVWKLATSGLDWVTGDVMRSHLYWKWTQSWTFEPLLRVDRVPGLLNGLAAAVVAFELSLPALVLSARGRWVALGGALAFHAGTAALFDIPFTSLWPCYVVFVPWHRLGERRSAPPMASPGLGVPRAMAPIAALTLAVWAAGARGETRGWPLACYPTFAAPARDAMPTLVAEVDGIERRLEDYAEPSSTLWAEVWRLVGIGGPVDPPALERFWLRHHPDERGEVRFYRAEVAVDPERRGQVRRVRLLHVMPASRPMADPTGGS